ncbi:hypothetical protein HDU98_009545 [Podochytrium sp. JEL0797]|nr:hypothetical protein HDU98_009545 [Podochytrium sp. JEL0797]
MSSFRDVSVKDIMYPPAHVASEDDEKIRKQYLISHWSYEPGEIRKHYGDITVPEHKLLPDTHDNNGLRVKEALKWTEESIKETHTKLSSKRLADWRRRRQPEIGKVHDPLKDTMAHLPEDYSFGISFPSDVYNNVGDLMGSGARAQADQIEKMHLCEEEEKNAAAHPEDPNAPKPKCGRRAAAQANREAQFCELTGKITMLPFESDKTEKNANQFIFGLPTVLRRRHGYLKKLADNNNYGDDLDAKSLLWPTPKNMYGAEFLDQFGGKHVDSESTRAHGETPHLPPAKVRPAIPI